MRCGLGVRVRWRTRCEMGGVAATRATKRTLDCTGTQSKAQRAAPILQISVQFCRDACSVAQAYALLAVK